MMSQKVNITNEASKPLYYGVIKTPIGNMIGCASDNGIVMLLFENEANSLINNAIEFNNHQTIKSECALLTELDDQLKAYFEGTLKNLTIQLDLQGSPFQKKTWDIVHQIQYGTTLTYKDVAIEIGNTKSSRAVANANAHNNCLLLIPCHRVVGTGNKLTGYRGGIEKKRWLLDFEMKHETSKKSYTLF